MQRGAIASFRAGGLSTPLIQPRRPMRASLYLFTVIVMASMTACQTADAETGNAAESSAAASRSDAAESRAAAASSVAAEADAAVEALCSDWRYDPSLSVDVNEASIPNLAIEVAPDAETGDVTQRAFTECPDAFRDFWAARDIVRAQQREASASAYRQTASSQPAATSTPSAGTQSNSQGDPELRTYLAGRGVDDALVRQLGAMADNTGYGLSPGSPLPFEQAQGFAVAIIDRCHQVSSGQITWSDALAEDVADGAPVSDAQDMISFLRSSFCPRVS